MTPGLAAALAVLVAAVALRPHPPRRHPGPTATDPNPDTPDTQWSNTPETRWPSTPAGRWSSSRRVRRRIETLPDASRRARPLDRLRTPPGPDSVARWCDELARATRSGSTLTAALLAAQPPAQAAATVDAVRLALDRGAPLIAALDRGPGGNSDVDLVLTVLRACADHGGPPAEPLDRAAATLRARAADRAERRTHSAQARWSAGVMTALPPLMFTVLVATSPSVRAVAFAPAGLVVLALGGLLNVAGWRWMQRIVGASA